MMRDIDIWVKFSEYLDYSYLDDPDNLQAERPTSEIGLIKNAPIEAIEAYKEYQKRENERIGQEEED